MSRTKERTSKNSDEPSNDGVTMQVWTRRPVCGTRATVVDRVGHLRSTGVIDDFEVRTWPEEVVLTEEEQRIPRLFEHLEQWANERGVSIRPPFERRTVSPLIGDSREVLTLPMLALAVYDDGLAGVYPCSDGDRTVTVETYLDRCETEGEPITGTIT
ncbi:MAG: HTH domain-containing protein [Halovenus sp.]